MRSGIPLRKRLLVRLLITSVLIAVCSVAAAAAGADRGRTAAATVTLAARRDGDHVVLDVTGTGTGIVPEDLPHVFDRFWRAEKSRSRRTGGSGLGLPIVRHLLAAHGGTAEATSEPGTGSVFTLRLPGGEPPKDT